MTALINARQEGTRETGKDGKGKESGHACGMRESGCRRYTLQTGWTSETALALKLSVSLHWRWCLASVCCRSTPVNETSSASSLISGCQRHPSFCGVTTAHTDGCLRRDCVTQSDTKSPLDNREDDGETERET